MILAAAENLDLHHADVTVPSKHNHRSGAASWFGVFVVSTKRARGSDGMRASRYCAADVSRCGSTLWQPTSPRSSSASSMQHRWMHALLDSQDL